MNHYQELTTLKQKLAKDHIRGLALDIDETLSFTLKHWFKELARLFGNPEKLDIDVLIKKYRYAKNVPYWQTPEALKWMEEQRESNELQTKFEVISNADKYIAELTKFIPISVYLTIRPQSVNQGTEKWLQENGFPKATILARPAFVPHSSGNNWKAEILEYLFPEIDGMIDDNPEVLEHLTKHYQGKFLLYSMQGYTHHPHQVICCPAWPDVVSAVKNIY